MSEGMQYKHILDERDRLHSSPKSKAISKVKHEQPRRLTLAEQKEKTKNWPKAIPGKEYGMKAQMGKHEENREFQRRTGRAWND